MLSDLTALSKCDQLTDVRLYNNRIRDISPLAALKNVCVLWLHGNPIANFWPLKGLMWLRELNIAQTDIQHVPVVLLTLRKLGVRVYCIGARGTVRGVRLHRHPVMPSPLG